MIASYKKIALYFWLMIAMVAPAKMVAQTTSAENRLSVSGEVMTPLILKAADILAMKHIEIKAKDNDGVTHTYAGVPLSDILQKAGVTLGKHLRGDNLSKFVLIKAYDGYQVVFSLPEIDPEFSNRMVLLADQADGKPLTQGIGPYRIIVPDEKKQARWIREIATIQVLFVKE